MSWFGGSIAGAAHRRTGQPNQDAWAARKDHTNGEVVVVADGLGSRERAADSARAACWAAITALGLADESADVTSVLSLIEALYEVRVGQWPRESTGSTCLVSRRTQRDWWVAQVGDGAALIVPRDRPPELLQPRTSAWLNHTEVLKRSARWHWQRLERRETEAVILMSDGVSDDLRDDRLDRFCALAISLARAPTQRSRSGRVIAELRRWPVPHSNDDKTLVVHLGTDELEGEAA